MMESIGEYPDLQAEDDGFLMQLRDCVIGPHIETLGIDACETVADCVRKIIGESRDAEDRGASLPLYVPIIDDDGIVRGYKAVPVWSGEHVSIPLYGYLMPDAVETLIKGTERTLGKLDAGFMAFSPAFRVALITHHINQMVAMNPMAAEAFVLGRYKELGLNDAHFDIVGVPATGLVQVSNTSGLKIEWVATSPTEYVGRHRLEAHINGWNVWIRGARPKRETLLNIWSDIRDRLDTPRDADYMVDGRRPKRLAADDRSKSRRRVCNPDVERMCNWVDSALADGTFPMRGKRKNWQEAVIMLGKTYPHLSDRWTADSMRKAYQHHKSIE